MSKCMRLVLKTYNYIIVFLVYICLSSVKKTLFYIDERRSNQL